MLCNETKSKHAQFWLAAGKAMEQTLIPVEYVGYGAEYVKLKKWRIGFNFGTNFELLSMCYQTQSENKSSQCIKFIFIVLRWPKSVRASAAIICSRLPCSTCFCIKSTEC